MDLAFLLFCATIVALRDCRIFSPQYVHVAAAQIVASPCGWQRVACRFDTHYVSFSSGVDATCVHTLPADSFTRTQNHSCLDRWKSVAFPGLTAPMNKRAARHCDRSCRKTPDDIFASSRSLRKDPTTLLERKCRYVRNRYVQSGTHSSATMSALNYGLRPRQLWSFHSMN